jgi:GNAT superfamily N-acetyltransferase
MNMLAVDVETDATVLVSAVDELYGHLAHRRAFVEHPDIGARLAPALRAAGWLAEHDVYSVLRRERDRPAAPGLAREVDEPTMRAVEAQTIAQQPATTEPAIVAQLLASRSAFGRAGRARYFVGAADGVDASHATLYSDGVIAQVEDVATLERFRGRGLARAVCSAAIDAALETGHELVFIIADDDDWPKELYAKLGFDPVGKPWSFTRPPAGHAAHRS